MSAVRSTYPGAHMGARELGGTEHAEGVYPVLVGKTCCRSGGSMYIVLVPLLLAELALKGDETHSWRRRISVASSHHG